MKYLTLLVSYLLLKTSFAITYPNCAPNHEIPCQIPVNTPMDEDFLNSTSVYELRTYYQYFGQYLGVAFFFGEADSLDQHYADFIRKSCCEYGFAGTNLGGSPCYRYFDTMKDFLAFDKGLDHAANYWCPDAGKFLETLKLSPYPAAHQLREILIQEIQKGSQGAIQQCAQAVELHQPEMAQKIVESNCLNIVFQQIQLQPGLIDYIKSRRLDNQTMCHTQQLQTAYGNSLTQVDCFQD